MMPKYLINRLQFITNTEAILKYIRTRHAHDNPPSEFSLNSIKSMPDALFLPLNEHIISLAVWNVELPQLADTVKQVALSKVVFGSPGKSLEATILARIEAVRKTMREASTDRAGMELFDRAVSNYKQFNFFSQYDWRLHHWGTVEDIHSVNPSTFQPPTSYLEFTTKYTPPIAAVQELANTFPSVRFKLKYHYHPEEPWIVEDIFAFPPFGY